MSSTEALPFPMYIENISVGVPTSIRVCLLRRCSTTVPRLGGVVAGLRHMTELGPRTSCANSNSWTAGVGRLMRQKPWMLRSSAHPFSAR